jgi:hypothetical protein
MSGSPLLRALKTGDDVRATVRTDAHDPNDATVDAVVVSSMQIG